MKAVGVLVLAAIYVYGESCEPICKCNHLSKVVYCTRNFVVDQLIATDCTDYRLELIPCSRPTPPPPPLTPAYKQPQVQLPVERIVRQESFHEVRVTHILHQQTVMQTSSTASFVRTETASVSFSDHVYDYHDQPSQSKNSRERFVEHLMELLEEHKIGLWVLGAVLVLIFLLLLLCRHNLPGQVVIFLRTLARLLWLLLRGRMFRHDRDAAVREILARAAEARRELFERECDRNRRLEERLANLDDTTDSQNDQGQNGGGQNPAQLNPQQLNLPHANNTDQQNGVDQDLPLIDLNPQPANNLDLLNFAGQPPDVQVAIPPENAEAQPEIPTAQPKVAAPKLLPVVPRKTRGFLDLLTTNPFRSQPLETSFSHSRRDSLPCTVVFHMVEHDGKKYRLPVVLEQEFRLRFGESLALIDDSDLRIRPGGVQTYTVECR